MSAASAERHRCIPTRGLRKSWWAEDREAAVEQAKEYHGEHGVPVLIVRHPEGGEPVRVTQVGSSAKSKKRRGC